MIAGTPLEQNPTIISKPIKKSPTESELYCFTGALANPELLANMSDPGSVCE